MASGTFFVSSSFLMTNDHNFATPEFGKAREHRAIVSEKFITVQFDKFIKRQVEVIFGIRPILVT